MGEGRDLHAAQRQGWMERDPEPFAGRESLSPDRRWPAFGVMRGELPPQRGRERRLLAEKRQDDHRGPVVSRGGEDAVVPRSVVIARLEENLEEPSAFLRPILLRQKLDRLGGVPVAVIEVVRRDLVGA